MTRTRLYVRVPPSRRWVLHGTYDTPEQAWRAALDHPARDLDMRFEEVEEEPDLFTSPADESPGPDLAR